MFTEFSLFYLILQPRWLRDHKPIVVFIALVTLLILFNFLTSDGSIDYCPAAESRGYASRYHPSVKFRLDDKVLRDHHEVLFSVSDKKRRLNESDVLSTAVDGKQQGGWLDSEQSVGRAAIDGKWFTVREPFDVYIYSAFYDERESLESLPVIRVVAVSIAQRVETRNLYCHILYSSNSSNPAYLSKARGQKIGAGMLIRNQMFTEYVFTCPTPFLPKCGKPRRIAFGGRQLMSPIWIDIEQPVRESDSGFLAVCVSVTYSQRAPSSRKLVEWLELQKILGVDKVVMYNHSAPLEYRNILESYEEFVELRQSHSFMSEDDLMGLGYQAASSAVLLHMSPVINDCMYRLSRSYRFIAVIDLDESIIPRHHKTIPELLEHLIQSKGSDRVQIASLVFKNAYFFLDIPDDSLKSRSNDEIASNSVYLRHKRRLQPSDLNYASKSIIHTSACYAMHNHFCWAFTEKAFREWKLDINVAPSLALLHHYKNCHIDSYEKVSGKCREMFKTAVYDNTISKYQTEFILSVERKLREINMLNEMTT